MSADRSSVGFVGLALVPIVCCIGLTLLLAAGLGAAALALVGAFTLAALALAAGIALVLLRRRRPDTGLRLAIAANGGVPLVEILSFDGCPHRDAAIALVERVSDELGVEPELRLVDIPDREAARRLRFLGSPTIRVGGRDVDPHAEERSDYALSCRVFRTDSGIAAQPDERWVREAPLRESGS